MTEPITEPAPDEEVPEWVGAIMRRCIACQKLDNHPKIIVAAVGNMASADVFWHHDCYVTATADGWEEIQEAIAGAEGRKGHQLRLHLMKGKPPKEET
jgi:hypothetical protein